MARTIRFGARPDIAWFDEVLYSEEHGRFRGTGVLTRNSGQWQLEHYAMSFLILNENWEEVVKLTRKTQALKESDEGFQTRTTDPNRVAPAWDEY